MQTETAQAATDSTAAAGEQLAALANYEGTAETFWPLYLQALGMALSARRVLLLSSGVGRPWQARAQWPGRVTDSSEDADWTLRLLGQAGVGAPHVERNAQGALALTMQVPTMGGVDAQVLALVVLRIGGGPGADAGGWHETSLRAWARLAVSVPGTFTQQAATKAQLLSAKQMAPSAVADPADRAPAVAATPDDKHSAPVAGAQPEAAERAERLHQLLQLAIKLNLQPHFMQMAMSLCNELALRFACDRVSLGWVVGPYVRLTAVSHVEKFEEKSAASRALEAAMEEALDQDTVLVYPAAPDTRVILRSHQAYAESLGSTSLTTVPLAGSDAVHAVVCLERQSGPLTAGELWELRLAAQLLSHGLSGLHARDRWFGARWYSAARRQASGFFGPEHTALKLTAVLSLVLLCVLVLLPWAFRVDASLAIRSKDLLFMPAPFDGYLRTVHVDIGDQVAAQTVLVELDTRDLVLEESMAEADFLRFSRETEKAQAARQLADMQISLARQQQSAAKLDLIRYQLGNASVRAPYPGVVIEGELKKNLGAPVRKGDLLLKLARTADTYLELEIDQADIHEVAVGSHGAFALVGKPEEHFEITLERIDPAAVTRDGRTFYTARAKLKGEFQSNWRPGMGGSAKLDAGQRSLIWVLTHRTVRFLRGFFWI
jgi:biotin carboxyl carrier protein